MTLHDYFEVRVSFFAYLGSYAKYGLTRRLTIFTSSLTSVPAVNCSIEFVQKETITKRRFYPIFFASPCIKRRFLK